MGGERTEKPTSKHRQDARKDGNIFKSDELVTLLSLAICFFAFKFLYPLAQSTILRIMTEYFERIGEVTRLEDDEYSRIFINCAINTAIAIGPITVIAAAVGVIGIMAQTKRYVNFKKLKPDFKKLSLIKGFKNLASNIFAPKGIVKQLKEIAKVTVIFVVIYNTIKDELYVLPRFMDIPLVASVQYTGDLIIEIIKNVCIAYLFIVGADYMWEKYQHEKQLRMSKEEIKEEFKQMEGDPKVKSKIRQKQMQMSMRRITEAMQTADVVIRNPTHYAVALAYDKDKNDAPIVVAKGIDFLALRIVDIAKELDVYCIENKPLARALYDSVDIDREIPADFYQAVADVLAFVYNLKNKEV
ncbi:MAG: flagellar biosynthesis protein FlhB [Oscillospiraceae bacterium]|jgi:flagellar biosynthetic protein FlhB|nr:flagellar biosynthesis protein FlhB [Oscillospiraceae bacterium]